MATNFPEQKGLTIPKARTPVGMVLEFANFSILLRLKHYLQSALKSVATPAILPDRS